MTTAEQPPVPDAPHAPESTIDGDYLADLEATIDRLAVPNPAPDAR